MEEKIILVDENDNEIGAEEKIKTHKEGKLHRAFSIFVFNNKNELLLQKRANNKYHSNGLWSNTCCSHPNLKEGIEEAAYRRLKEEMGFNCELKKIFSFCYKTPFNNGLIENELDHVFIGKFNGKVKPNAEEVEDYRWASIDKIKQELEEKPENYSYWFKLAFPKIIGFKLP